ncbi:unnamed protein product, partial [Closterium sp. NIES-54]
MSPGQQASAVDMAVEGAEDEEEEGLEAATSTEAAGVADTAMTTRTTDAVADGSTASVIFATRADTCGTIATNSLIVGPLLKAKRVEEQEEGEEDAVEAVAVAEVVLQNEMVDGVRVKAEPDEVLGCPTCMQAKFTCYPFSSSEATGKAPLDEVVMDVVGPLKLGAAGAEYFLTIVDIYTRMTWVYVLSKKSDVAETVKTDWLPMVERQQDQLVKAIRTDRGGEFLSKEFSLWLKKNGRQFIVSHWDLHKDRIVYNEMWQIPVVPMPKERQVAASISTKGEAVGSGDGANGRAKEIDSKKCNLGGTSKFSEHEESSAAAHKQHKGEENPKEASEEDYGENMWGTIASAAFSNPTSAKGECDWLTLHQRLGHAALPILQQLVKNEMVDGVRVKGEPDEVLGCLTCMQAKFTRYLFSSSEATDKAPLDEVVMDVVGPLKLGAAIAEYFLTIVDVYTRMTWVYVLSKKRDVAETMKTDWLPMVERQQDRLVKAIRTDRGGEFLSKEFSLWLKKNGIRNSLTMPYSPAMNSIAELANRTITETARGLLIEARQPEYFWPDAVQSACVAKNRALTHLGADKWVPYVEWVGRKPRVDMLRVFGCMCMALVPKHLRHNKLGAKAIWAVHLGMAQNRKGWLLWDPFTKKFLVRFRFGACGAALGAQQWQHHHKEIFLVNGGEEAKDAEEEEEEVQQEEGRGKRRTKAPNRLTYDALGRPAKSALAGAALIVGDDDESDYDECAFVFFSPVEMPGEPATLKEALESSDAEEWKKAMESELTSIEENGTWELVELPEGRKAITSKWLFKIKSDADGKIERYKSRLVAKGYQQKEKVDYKELFAPVVKPTTLRTLLAGAAIKGWVVKQMDVTTAFLNGVLEEEIFMAQPEGLEDGSGRVLKLKKALYGLKEALRQWYLKLRGVLEEIGFTPSTADHSLFMLGEGEQRSFMVVYVDDILIFSPSSDLVKEVMLKLQD